MADHPLVRAHVQSDTLIVNYLQLLTDDVLGLVLPYVLYDSKQDHPSTLVIFAQSLFVELVKSRVWIRLTNDRSRIVYRTYWSSNDFLLHHFLRPDGTIDYERLLVDVCNFDAVPAHMYHSAVVDFISPWSKALSNHLDIQQMTVRSEMAAYLATLHSGAFVDHSSVTKQLVSVFRLGHIFAAPHRDLENEIIILCDLLDNSVVFTLLRDAAFKLINYQFYLTLYSKYIEPHIGTTLKKNDVTDVQSKQITYWRYLWLQAAVWTNDVEIFRSTHEHLGYARTEIVALFDSTQGLKLGLSMNSMCEADAATLVEEFDLWAHMTRKDLRGIMVGAPRLRAALHARHYLFAHDDMRDFGFHGLPCHLQPFLPPDATPLLFISSRFLSTGMLLALLAHIDRPLSWTEIYQMLTSPSVKEQGNLANYILPVTRVMESAFQPHLAYITERWGCVLQPDGSYEGVVDLNKQSSCCKLYHLFLLSCVDRGHLPRVPFCCYLPAEIIYNFNGTSRQEDDDKFSLIFHPQAHRRIFSLSRTADTSFITPTTTVICDQTAMYIHIPPHETFAIADLSDDIAYELYDYDVPDFVWWAATFAKYYGAA